MKWSQIHTEVLNGILLLLLGLAIWLYSGTFPDLQEGYPGPALFPRLISSGFAISGLVLLIAHLPKVFAPGTQQTSGKPSSAINEPRIYTLLGGISIVALFPFISELAGFLGALGISVLAIALLFRINYLKSALLAVGTLSMIYLTFNVLLGVPL